jgi:hypothetical protein
MNLLYKLIRVDNFFVLDILQLFGFDVEPKCIKDFHSGTCSQPDYLLQNWIDLKFGGIVYESKVNRNRILYICSHFNCYAVLFNEGAGWFFPLNKLRFTV